LQPQGVEAAHIAGVLLETYQGGNASFAPAAYMQQLRAWCDRHDALLICDEVQAGFGRCGTFWGFELYDVTPDLICCGKGVIGGPPLSAVIGRADVMDLYPPGSMTSTHAGNTLAAAAALANLRAFEEDGLVENARRMGQVLQPELRRIGERFGDIVGAVHGKGLVASLHIVKPGGTEPDAARATDIVQRCYEKGLLMFAPVGYGGASVKVSPALCIAEEPLRESIRVLEEAMEESIQPHVAESSANT
jgi:4-aminobutyrate aminotransferase-like enzyme